MSVLTNPYDIETFRLKTLRAALKLELMGLSHSGGSILSRLKREGLVTSRTRRGALVELEALIASR